MYVKTVNLWENTLGTSQEVPTLDIYVPEKKTCDISVVIYPGGGYHHRAIHEGKGYAEFLNEHGITAFVCQYRVLPHRFPMPLLDARRAVRYARFHSEEYGISKNKVYVMGSSAGGHLAAITSTYLKPLESEGTDEIDREDFRPNGQILCYPVIDLSGELAQTGTAINLLGDRLDEMGAELSPQRIVDGDTPRAFLWHTFSDNVVNVENSLQYAACLHQVGVNAEVHIYPQGRHGLGLASDVPHTCNWSRELLEWLFLYEDAGQT